MPSPAESSFRNSPEVLTARLLYQHRLAAPEPFEESNEYEVAIQAYNRARSPLKPLKTPLLVVLGIWGSCVVLCGLGLTQFCPGTYLKTLLKQGEPHPGLSRVAPSGALVNPDRNG